MLNRIFLMIAAIMLAPTAHAADNTCRMGGAQAFPEIEAAKALFLKGDFRGYLDCGERTHAFCRVSAPVRPA